MGESREQALMRGVRQLGRRVPMFAERVAPLYVLLNWTWKDAPRPPTKDEIVETLDSLIDDTIRAISEGHLDTDEGWSTATGGLQVSYEGEGQFFMTFTVEEFTQVAL